MANENDICSICKQFDAKVYFDQFSCTIAFKDGKTLRYAMDNQAKDVDSILRRMNSLVKSGAHGRVFSKDSTFIGYAPEGKSIDEILVAVDLML